MIKHLSAVVLGLAVTVGAALADTPLTRTFLVVPEAYQEKPLPGKIVPDVANFALVVENPSKTTARLLIPEAGVDEYIPWASSKTITVDLSKAGVDGKLDYMFKDARGSMDATLATGALYVGSWSKAYHSDYDSASFNARMARSQQTLVELMRRNQVVERVDGLTFPQKPDPVYTGAVEQPAPKKSKFVRGYW